jgi:hypothetical protein
VQRVCDHVLSVFDRAVEEHKAAEGGGGATAMAADEPAPSGHGKRPSSSSKKR